MGKINQKLDDLLKRLRLARLDLGAVLRGAWNNIGKIGIVYLAFLLTIASVGTQQPEPTPPPTITEPPPTNTPIPALTPPQTIRLFDEFVDDRNGWEERGAIENEYVHAEAILDKDGGGGNTKLYNGFTYF